ncbi:MAG TPA: leucyl/phenylalanyl-tRNA--protein transferase, partial [Pseudohongiella sp.]|nr:leucyl/phenylalanyl-tRNA--protein transferase [Pseudohongiella sp.]
LEVWQQDESGRERLVGGLYGIALGRMFFGESMFSLLPNVSKLAFIALANQLRNWEFTLIDCQLPTDHLASLGANPISRDSFLRLLAENRPYIDTITASHWQISDTLRLG